jgi:hypothetical protein
MSGRDRVIVVQHASSGTLLKVCDDWDAYDAWLSRHRWDEEQISTKSAAVYDP